MKANPKKTAQRLQKVMNVWKTLRPTKTFGGMTLEQFTGKVQPAMDTRAQLNVLQNQVTESLTQRQQHDQASHDLANLVVNAVKGDPEEGEDGPLYAALGYIPKSQRRSGLTRKGQTTAPTVTPAVK